METALIHSYSRRTNAIEDGSLIDVSAAARDAGFRTPVALTSPVWKECVSIPPGAPADPSASTRLWEMLWMLLLKIRSSGAERSELLFSVSFAQEAGSKQVTLKAICSPGADARPVITIMLPSED